ncbi:MAG: translation elongation factor Ts [Chlorobium sp.]|uniref:translation elongation factor Ts n=1 Tax=Chlorobium sp. TaxID=1095 RepID=UPI0025B9E10A|nr:translation elongation factor Ts [Chlorobium sp.]MCF8215480.1 translation elongation factor Ts [Chlorobium sp.]MCF8270295.1 translation elongation factor Ts [Chlorobium sp.]MCF8286687.1 translation elongation factor Ts [Chlorobium sp.]MCF8290380.1 translation elongation factor Ts [Chlorobium sp.]MCF8384263.1 translation elongation factor Ts [Chlorobium sp.]
MSQISAKDVKDLRDTTGVGMMDCKKALEETGGDMQKAIEYLRKKGAALAAKRAEKDAREGMVAIKLTDDCKNGVILELNCETDFVARGEVFTGFANALASLALRNGASSPEELLALTPGDDFGGEKVDDAMKTMTGKLGEKLELKRLVLCQAPDGVIESYVHPGSQLGTLVQLVTDKPEEARELAKDLAMQVAAASPIVVDRSAVPADYIDKEMEIYRQQALGQGKPEQFVEKIVVGRLEKYYQEVVLTEQSFIKDSTVKVSDVLADFRKKHQATVEVKGFIRYQLGE